MYLRLNLFDQCDIPITEFTIDATLNHAINYGDESIRMLPGDNCQYTIDQRGQLLYDSTTGLTEKGKTYVC